MSLLPYVIAFIMVLTAITYSRIESMKAIVSSSIAFRAYTNSHERFSQKETWEKVYDDIVVKEGAKSGNTSSIEGNAKLNLKLIFKNEQATAEDKQAHRNVLTRLIYALHSDEPYFASAMQQNPDWIEHLLNELSTIQIKSIKDINELLLNDPLLNSMLYQLMKEKKSLALYCTVSSKPKVSVFLASKQLLLAIYEDPKIVKEIEEERNRISKEARRQNSDMKALKEEFGLLKNKFPTSFDAYLCYGISKTDTRQRD
jgi:hypothetical protein